MTSNLIKVFIAIISLLPGILGLAATYYTVPASNLVSIDEHTLCRNVTNNYAKDMFIPTNTLAEWNSFITNTPVNVGLGNCCPAGYVNVPGNAVVGTSDFCVMQYEAKDVAGVATSQESGAPWGSIDHTTAVAECKSLGAGYDLISILQWSTIAKNLEYVDANWSGAGRGLGCHNHGNMGTNSSCSYNGPDPSDSGAGRNTTARSQLSNGAYIWDLGGNLEEHTRGFFHSSSSVLFDSAYDSGAGDGLASGLLRTIMGPDGNYSPGGCVGDDSADDQCGFGYIQFDNVFLTVRGGRYNSTSSGIFKSKNSSGSASSTRGFRCVYRPEYSTWVNYSNPSPPSNGNFETGDFTGWTQTSGDNGDWEIDTTTTYAGTYSAAAPASLGNSEKTCIERTLDLSAASNDYRVQWKWKVSSEERYDFLTFYVDDSYGFSASGNDDWFMEYIILKQGSSYNLKFCYEKDSSSAAGSDQAWLDDYDEIELTP